MSVGCKEGGTSAFPTFSFHLVSPWKSQSFFIQPLQDQLVMNFRLDFRNSVVSPKVIPKDYLKFWLLQSKYLPANSLSPHSSAGTHIHLPSGQKGEKLGMLIKYWGKLSLGWLKELRAVFGPAEHPDCGGGSSVFHGRVLLPGKSECRTQKVLHSPEPGKIKLSQLGVPASTEFIF